MSINEFTYISMLERRHKKSFGTDLRTSINNMCTNFHTKWLKRSYRSIDIGEVVKYQSPTSTGFNDSHKHGIEVV